MYATNHERERKRQADALRQQQQSIEAMQRASHNRRVVVEITALKDQCLNEIKSLVALKTWSLKDTLRARVKKLKESLTYDGVSGIYNTELNHLMRAHDQALEQRFSQVLTGLEQQIDKAGALESAIPHAFESVIFVYESVCRAGHGRAIVPETETSILALKTVMQQQKRLYKNRFEILKKDLQEGYDIWSRACQQYHQTYQSTVAELKALDEQFLKRIQDFYPLLSELDLVHAQGCKAGVRLLFLIHAGERPDLELLIKDREAALASSQVLNQRLAQRGKLFRFSAEGRETLRELKTCKQTLKRYDMIEMAHMKDVAALMLLDQGLCVQASACRWYQFLKKKELLGYHSWLSGLINMLEKHSAVDALYHRLESPTWAQAKYVFQQVFYDFLARIAQHRKEEPIKSFFKSEPMINLRYDLNEVTELLDKLVRARGAFNEVLKAPQLNIVSSHTSRGHFCVWTHGGIVQTTRATPESLSSLHLEAL